MMSEILEEMCSGCDGDECCQIQFDLGDSKYGCLIPERYAKLDGDAFVYFTMLNDIRTAMIEWDTRTYEREGKTVIKGYDLVIDTIKEILDNSPFTTNSEEKDDG